MECRNFAVRDAVRGDAFPAEGQGEAAAHDHLRQAQVHQERRRCVSCIPPVLVTSSYHCNMEQAGALQC